MRPRHFQRALQLRCVELRERRPGPALLSPGVRDRRKGVGRQLALELLLRRA